jgi:two-component system cell cycle response regulator
MKVLIAEDDVTSRAMLKAMVSRWGFETETACDGQEAWERVQGTDAPKLMILDWMMPGMDGIEVCRRIRQLETPEPPYIIILTARGDKSDIVKGLGAGANDYLSKPYDSNELRARIEVGRRVLELQGELWKALENFRHLALTDPLTLVPNRRAILDVLESEMARSQRQGTSLWVSVLDVDHFKTVNDTLGHRSGDTVLKECSIRIRSVLRSYDSLGRLGGDEFLIIVPGSAGDSPEGVFERVRSAVAGDCLITGEMQLQVTVTQGVAAWDTKETMDDLLNRADDALYRAKELGRNRVEYAPGYVPF